MFARNKHTGALITAELHTIPARLGALRDTFRKGEDGRLACADDGGGFFPFWDAATPATDDHGRIFLDEDGAQVPEADVELGKAKGYDVIDANLRVRWRASGEEVPDCCVCACFGPEGEGDAADLNLSTMRDAYTLCNDCSRHVESAEVDADDDARRALVAQGCDPTHIDRVRAWFRRAFRRA